jgi:hypothetical protein
MLNARPTLTFNGAASADRNAAEKNVRRPERPGENFASYLKAEQPGTKNPAAQTVQDAVVSAYKAAQAAVAQKTRPASALRARPEGLVVKSAPESAEPALYTAHAPESGRTTVAATQQPLRPYAATDATRVLARQPAVPAPRVSGRPITGRNGIGMTDTRKRAQDDDASGSATPAPAAQRRSAVMAASHASAATGRDTYASFGRHSGADAGHSFLNVGFASRSAEVALKKLGYDIQRAGGAETRATPSDPASTGGARAAVIHPEAEAASAAENLRKSTFASARGTRGGALPALPLKGGNEIGALAAKFESGEEGIAAVGYDGKGGTSYGKFQISSRVGTMRAFLGYLRDNAPDLAKRLAACGPANTGSRSGRMPEEWRRIAEEQPERFDRLQSDFIRTSHFEPAVAGIAGATGVSFDTLPPVLREVLFSTAVQHGPAGAVRIVGRAMAEVNPDKLPAGGGTHGAKAADAEGRKLITKIYALRAGHFASSSPGTQEAVYNRLKQEMREALEMLV